MELARAIMCPANCIAPQSIVAGGKRRDVFHLETVSPGAFLDRPFLLRVRVERPRRHRDAEKELAPSYLKISVTSHNNLARLDGPVC
jgi:hypothetical protein